MNVESKQQMSQQTSDIARVREGRTHVVTGSAAPSQVMVDADVANGEAGTLAPDRSASDHGRTESRRPRTTARDVTFRTAPEQGGERVAVVGEFNDWSISSHPMIRRGDHFELVVPLPPGRYRFRYLVDGHRWENDWRADAYEPNSFGGEDSVIDVPSVL